MGTYEKGVYPDQLWQLRKEPDHCGYYTINNLKWEGYRVTKFKKGDRDVGVYNGDYYEDQYWKFQHIEGNHIHLEIEILFLVEAVCYEAEGLYCVSPILAQFC